MAASDEHDAPRLADQLVSGITAMADDLVVGFDDAVGEPVIPHELPDVFDRIEFRTFGRQWDNADILEYDERGGDMPPGLIQTHNHEANDNLDQSKAPRSGVCGARLAPDHAIPPFGILLRKTLPAVCRATHAQHV